MKKACAPGSSTRAWPPSRSGAPGVALPRGPLRDPEALRKRFRSGRRQDGGGHAGEAGGRVATGLTRRTAGPKRGRRWRERWDRDCGADGGGGRRKRRRGWRLTAGGSARP
ncbi:hypothetical protein ACRRTK_008790 [Alexandromys fortis]